MKVLYIFFFTALLLGMGSSLSAQTAGIWRGSLDVTLSGNTTNYKSGVGTGTDLQGASLGSITPASTFTLNNPYLFSYKNGTCDVTGGSLRYRVYKQGSTPGSYTTINFGFQCNCTTMDPCGGCWLCSVSPCNNSNNDQQWGTAVNVDLKAAALAADGSVGTYVLEVDWNISTAGAGCTADPSTVAASATFEVTTPLPVQLVSFRARPLGQAVRLEWATATERQNRVFEVHHSADMHTWTVVGSVAGGNTSAALRSYTFDHRPARPGLHYYRLRQVDTNGDFAFTPVRSAALGGAVRAALQPNPVTGTNAQLSLSATATGTAHLRLMDATGRLLRTWEVSAETDQVVELDLNAVPNGLFFLIINGEQALRVMVER